VVKGHLLSNRDRAIRDTIMGIACHGHIPAHALKLFTDRQTRDSLKAFCHEGIIAPAGDGFKVTERGRAFIRNVCSVFDEHLRSNAQNSSATRLFSTSI